MIDSDLIVTAILPIAVTDLECSFDIWWRSIEEVKHPNETSSGLGLALGLESGRSPAVLFRFCLQSMNNSNRS